MTSKLSPFPVLKAHFDTLRNSNTNRPLLGDYFSLYGIPLLVGAFSYSRKFQAQDVGAFLGGVAVFAALLFALVVFVFQLRLSAGKDPVTASKYRLLKLLDELFANVSYAVLVGLVTTFLGIASVWLSDDQVGAPVWLSVLLVAAVTHLVLTILMCLKRINAAYRRLTS